MAGDRHEISVNGSRFTIFRKDDRVEVYRTSAAVLPRRSQVFADAGQAIRETTGCDVVQGSLTGDVALMKAELDCG